MTSFLDVPFIVLLPAVPTIVQITPVEVFVLVAASTALAKPTAKRIAPTAITTRLIDFDPKVMFMT